MRSLLCNLMPFVSIEAIYCAVPGPGTSVGSVVMWTHVAVLGRSPGHGAGILD